MNINLVDAYAQLMKSVIVKKGTADTVSSSTDSTESYNILLLSLLEEMGLNGTVSGKIK